MARRPYTEAALKRLGQAVTTRRAQLGMGSQREFSQRSGIAPDRVSAIETGTNWPIGRIRTAAEAALNWRAGSFTRIAEGGDPADEAIESTPPALHDTIRQLASLTRLDQDTKLDLLTEAVTDTGLPFGEAAALIMSSPDLSEVEQRSLIARLPIADDSQTGT